MLPSNILHASYQEVLPRCRPRNVSFVGRRRIDRSTLVRGAERRERFSAQTRLGGGGTRGIEERSRRLKVTRFRFRGRGKEFDDEIDECAKLWRHELTACVDRVQRRLLQGIVRKDRGQYLPERRVVEQNHRDRCD